MKVAMSFTALVTVILDNEGLLDSDIRAMELRVQFAIESGLSTMPRIRQPLVDVMEGIRLAAFTAELKEDPKHAKADVFADRHHDERSALARQLNPRGTPKAKPIQEPKP